MGFGRTFFCETTSDVFQLKTYLQDQYPTKPKPTEQRLIYSGKLLLDHEILKDFLRDLDSEPMHTIHLVYTLTHSSGDVPEQSTPNMTNVSPVFFICSTKVGYFIFMDLVV